MYTFTSLPFVVSKPQLYTLYNVCSVPWGVFSTVGDMMSAVGVFSTVGGKSFVI